MEKAHPDVFNILLQALDYGHITDSQGHKIDFKNTIVIMTSNAGAENIIAPRHRGFTSQDDEKARYTRMKTGVMDEVKRLFKPEFLNRIDEIIVFHPLNKYPYEGDRFHYVEYRRKADEAADVHPFKRRGGREGFPGGKGL